MAPILHSMRVLCTGWIIVGFLVIHRLISLSDVYELSRAFENEVWLFTHSSVDLISQTRGIDVVCFIDGRGRDVGDGFGAAVTIPLVMESSGGATVEGHELNRVAITY